MRYFGRFLKTGMLLLFSALIIFSCSGESAQDVSSLLLLSGAGHWDSTAITPVEVVEYSPESSPVYNNSALALGYPHGGGEYAGSTDVVSLGFDMSGQGGYIILRFAKKIINGAGTDFKVFENPFGSGSSRFMEAATLQLSLDGTTWYDFPTSFNGDPTDAGAAAVPANYLKGYAGINPVISDWDDPTSPLPEDADSGGDFFDLDDMTSPIKESGFFYIKVIDAGVTVNDMGNSDTSPADGIPDFGYGGFDLDAVVGINYTE